jgi:hypothetical protein
VGPYPKILLHWNRGSTEPTSDHAFSVEMGMMIMNYVWFFFFVHKRIISAVKKVEFVTDRMLYIIIRGYWCDVILNVNVPNRG